MLFAAKGHRIRDKDAQPITTPTGELKLPAGRQSGAGALPRVSAAAARVEAHAREHIGLPDRRPVIRDAPQRRDSRGRRLRAGTRTSTIWSAAATCRYIFGAGLQHRRWLVDARFTRGMRNIALDPAAVAVKTGAFSVLMGARF